MKKLPIKTKLICLVAFMSAVLVAVGWIGLSGMRSARASLESVYKDRLVAAIQLASIRELLSDSRREMLSAVIRDLPNLSRPPMRHAVTDHERRAARIEANLAEMDKTWRKYLATYLTPEEKQLAKSVLSSYTTLVEKGIKPGIALLRGNDMAGLDVHLRNTVLPLGRKTQESIEALIRLQDEVARTELARNASAYSVRFALSVIGIALAVLAGIVISAITIRSVTAATGRLRESENRYRTLFESSHDALLIMSGTTIIDCNRKALEMFAGNREQLLGISLSGISADFQVDGKLTDDEIWRRLNASLEGRPQLFEWRHKRLDGSLFDAEVSMDRIGLEGETVLQCIVRDISERKRAEEALMKSEKKFATIFHAAPALIAISTLKDGRLIDVNEDALQTLGYRREEIIGRTVHEINLWEYPSDRAKTVRIIEEQGSIRDLEVRFRGKSGQIFTGLFSSELISFDGERYMLSLVRDITDRKQAEEEIKRLNADLTERAAELEEVNRDLETFNYTVAHDLRQPINIVSGYCQAIEEFCGDKLDDQCLGFLQEAHDSTLRMNRLIDALLNFSSVARVELHKETVDLSVMARWAAEELKLAEPERRVTFRFVDGLSAEGDPNLLRLVLSNLLGNAWKYTGTREEAIIEFGTMEIDGKPAYFVRDNGPGFDMADVGKLFIPFQRLAGAEERRGFGIGLATVERIIRRHGGKVGAKGELGKGATFYFTLSN